MDESVLALSADAAEGKCYDLCEGLIGCDVFFILLLAVMFSSFLHSFIGCL